MWGQMERLLFCGDTRGRPVTDKEIHDQGRWPLCAPTLSALCSPHRLPSALHTSSQSSGAETGFLRRPPPLTPTGHLHTWGRHSFLAEGSSFPFHSPLPSMPPLLLGTEGCFASRVALEASKCSPWGRLPQPYREVELAAEGLQGSQPQEAQVRLLSLTHGTVHGHTQGFSFSF